MEAPKIKKLLTPYNFTNKNSEDRSKYIVMHFSGALGGAEANCRYFASKYIGASAHYFIGFDGEIWQSVEDEDIAWHCGAKSYKHPECRNSNSIGIELCVRNKGSQTADSRDWYFEDATVKAAIELVRYLMEKYGITVDHVVRHYDVTGKICPNPYVYNHTEHTWEAFKKALVDGSDSVSKDDLTKITGKAVASAEQMEAYIKAKNSSVPKSVLDMIPLYLLEGEAENIRGDIAFAQSCLETGNFTFSGSAVELSQNNFCGMGVTANGVKGNSFDTPQLGIRAQIQHLKAYANTAKLKQECIDPRFTYVTRGSAPYVEHLGIQENPKGKGWAAGAGYGGKILAILSAILSMEGDHSQSQPQNPDKLQDESDKKETDILYRITTTCDVLNIRSGPGTRYPISGAIREKLGKKKQYTIVREENGWGLLKSGAGWISLAYTAKVSETAYLITTTCDVLNIRSGPGIQYRASGSIREKAGEKKQYTIEEEQAGWGRLKSGAGWISLKYTKRVS